jgi:outer membrane protein assembly factor BamB
MEATMSNRPITLLAAFSVMLGALGSEVRADNWPAWRGPHGNGVCVEKNLPLKWSATDNVVWKVALPDEGNSTPIIWKDRIFLTQAAEKGKKRSTICFSKKDGSKLWEKTVEYDDKEPTHQTNPYCSASPVTDGERVVVFHGSAGLFCYDLDGKELWKRELGKCFHIWGNGSSPIIDKDSVILNFGPGPRQFLIAMNKKNGDELWKVDEPGGKEGTMGEAWIGSWSTPLVTTLHGREELIQFWPGIVKAYNPKNGELLWSCKGLEKDKAKDRLVYTTPLVTPDVIVAMGGFNGAAIALKTGGKGDVTDSLRLWRHPSGPQRIGSGVIVGAHVFIVNEPGTAQCIAWKTGKILWTERAGAGAWGSSILVEDKIYVTNVDGETIVLAAKPEFEVLARNPLKERTMASIAVSDQRLYIRTYKHLWCIGK